MLLAVDVGNTNVKLGVYDDRRLVASWRLTTRREQTADEYGVFTHTMLRSHGLEPPQVTDVAISSTVPAVQRTMEDMAGRYFGLAPFVVDPGVNVALPHARRLSARGGPDRVVKVVAAVELYGPPLIIIDFGTATTFECVSPARRVHRRRHRAGHRDRRRGADRPGRPALSRRSHPAGERHRPQHGDEHPVGHGLRLRGSGRRPGRPDARGDGGDAQGGGAPAVSSASWRASRARSTSSIRT